MKKISLILTLLKIPSDTIGISIAIYTAYYLRYQSDFRFGQKIAEADIVTLTQFLSQTYGFIPLAIIMLLLVGSYSFKRNEGYLHQVGQVCLASMITFMAILTYYFISRDFPLSRLSIIYLPFLITIWVSLGRLIIQIIKKILLKKGIGRRRILLLGDNKISAKIAKVLAKDYNFKLIGHLGDHAIKDSSVKWLGKYDDLEKICQKYQVEEIVQSTPEKDLPASNVINICRKDHIEYYYIPTNFDIHEYAFQFQNLKGIPWLKWQKTPLDGWGRIIKRCFDLLISIPLLIILSPLFCLIAILIKMDSPGTVFFKYLDDGTISKRIGQKGRPFYCYKFRSMKSKTHEQRYKELSSLDHRNGPIVKIKDDPRITRIGKLLRRLDFDELPQLINVVIGNMSLVGPRPHLPEEVAKYDAPHKFVLTIKPGITGMAQVSGRSKLNFEDEIRLDSYYIEHWSLWLDIKILVKTIPVVLFKSSD